MMRYNRGDTARGGEAWIRPPTGESNLSFVGPRRGFGDVGRCASVWHSTTNPWTPRFRPSPLRGFTLIEAVVVISIISLLAALLLPSLNQARRAAVIALCKSNLHQLGVGTANYAADHRGLCWPFPAHDGFFVWIGSTLGGYGDPVLTTRRWGLSAAPGWVQHGALMRDGYVGTYDSLAARNVMMCPGLGRDVWGQQPGHTVTDTHVRYWPEGVGGNTVKYWTFIGDNGKSTYWPREAIPDEEHEFGYRYEQVDHMQDPSMSILSCHIWRGLLGHDAKGVNILYMGGQVAWMNNFETSDGGTILGLNNVPGNGYQGVPGWGDGLWLPLFRDYYDKLPGG